ncbi:hypothetical protein CK1_38340 [Ruminococcus sp. SR1/5]|nr:hypothetical protein CK1_38340 [Ruminococcus sp. SR1/5]
MGHKDESIRAAESARQNTEDK